MKILHVCEAYHPSVGGNQTHMQELSEFLVKLGHDVTVFTSDFAMREEIAREYQKDMALPAVEAINGVRVRRFRTMQRFSRFCVETLPTWRGGHRLNRIVLGDSVSVLRRGLFTPGMLPRLVTFGPDVLMALGLWGLQAHLCVLVKRLLPALPLVVIPSFNIGAAWSDEAASTRALRSADLVLALTEAEREFVLRKGIDAHKVEVIGVGLNPGDYRESDGSRFRQRFGLGDSQLVLFAGRKSRDKGIDSLLSAMLIVWRVRPNVRLILAGRESEYFATVKERIAALDDGDRERIVLIGAFGKEEKGELFSSCDVFVLPSKSESFGIVYLEAWLMRRPVIGCRDPARAILIQDGMDGVLVEYGNDGELAVAILNLLQDDEKRRRFGGRGREKVLSRFTWEVIGTQVSERYGELVRQARGGSRAVDHGAARLREL